MSGEWNSTMRELALQVLSAATPGPWTLSPTRGDVVVAPRQPGTLPSDDEYYGGTCVAESMHTGDRRFVAAARQLLPAALKEIERLEAEMAEMAIHLRPGPTAADEAKAERAATARRRGKRRK
jgi:hypothetical protein